MKHPPHFQLIGGKVVEVGCPCGKCDLRRMKIALAVIVFACVAGVAGVVLAVRL